MARARGGPRAAVRRCGGRVRRRGPSAGGAGRQRHAGAGAGRVTGRAHASGADLPARSRGRAARTRPAQLPRRPAGQPPWHRGHRRHPRRLAAEPGLRVEHVELRQAGQPVLHLPPAGHHDARAERLDLRRQGRPDRRPGGVRLQAGRGGEGLHRHRRAGGHLRGDLHLRWLPPRDHGEVGQRSTGATPGPRCRSPAAPSTRKGCATCSTGPSTRCGRSRQALRTSPIGPRSRSGSS